MGSAQKLEIQECLLVGKTALATVESFAEKKASNLNEGLAVTLEANMV